MNSLALLLLLFFTIAVALAVFWYAYTTFTSTSNTYVTIRAAMLYYQNGTLRIIVVNPGPNPAYVNAVYLNDMPCNITGEAYIPSGALVEVRAVCPKAQIQTAQGTLIANGYPLPFTAALS
ncbi:MAG: hypothetical protein ABWJ97_07255 [Thermoproteus sp.]